MHWTVLFYVELLTIKKKFQLGSPGYSWLLRTNRSVTLKCDLNKKLFAASSNKGSADHSQFSYLFEAFLHLETFAQLGNSFSL